MNRDWWIEYKVTRCYSEGLAAVLHGPKTVDKSGSCHMDVQVIEFGDMVPWYKAKCVKMEVAREEAEALYSLLEQARVTPFPPTAAGCDGEHHTLKLGAFENSAQFTWYCELPECWMAFQPVVSKMLSFAKECLGDKGCFHDVDK